ncbi:TetR/AcrR family transcriptional regulator [Demequina oxidasica]|uniref:TetR/AcrR family transcriptional regulator n=1 Tax=Demequina oxidasica TaxID=676199 RepID=UPI000782E6E5|nr:TetR family transcriptional regulator [Demequina oxidasica]
MTAPAIIDRPQRRDAAENREIILSAAAAVLSINPDASVDDIAAAASLSRRAVYGHFSGRDAIVEQTLTRGASRIATSVASVEHEDALVELALLGATLWAEVNHARALANFALRGPHRRQVAAALAPLRSRLEETIARGVRDNDIRSDIAPKTLARLIEGGALAVLDEATRARMSLQRGHRLVILSALSTAGMSWRGAEKLIDTHPILHVSMGAK